MKHHIIGILLIILGISTMVPTYLVYCWLIKNYNCSETGAVISCTFTCIGLVLLFVIYGVVQIQTGFDKKH